MYVLDYAQRARYTKVVSVGNANADCTSDDDTEDILDIVWIDRKVYEQGAKRKDKRETEFLG